MEGLAEYTKAGKDLGLEGKQLMDFVSNQQKMTRDARQEQRDIERQEREYQEQLTEASHRRAIELLKAQQQVSTSAKKSSSVGKPPKLPSYDDKRDDIDAYLLRYERHATSQNWPSGMWASYLSALLTGRALDVYSRLPACQINDFQQLKLALLKRFMLTSEGF